MTFSHHVMQDVHVLKLDRPLSGRWAGEVELTFRAISQNGASRVVFDMESIPFIDQHGLAALVKGWELLNGSGKNLHLVSPQAQPQLVFELTGFDKIFSITDDAGKVV